MNDRRQKGVLRQLYDYFEQLSAIEQVDPRLRLRVDCRVYEAKRRGKVSSRLREG